ncbi:MAG TPA: flagellar assembly protein FliW [Fimbriimonadaceae bacterium]|nr:flagellar assembly protein FliW [Fimbriimonadaceae bacterium]
MPTLDQTRFGSLDYTDSDILTFTEGLIGFAHCQRFILVQTQSKGSFRWLQSIEEPKIAFLVVDPASYVRGYALEIEDDEAESLAIGPDTATLVLTTASIPPGRPQEMTINLAGPIVINADARTGRQLIVDNEACPAKHRVFEDGGSLAKAA